MNHESRGGETRTKITLDPTRSLPAGLTATKITRELRCR